MISTNQSTVSLRISTNESGPLCLEEGTVTGFASGVSAFSFMFNDEVKVKKTSVDKFSFMDSLNFFGSNLGLWPGLGLYQIIEWMAGIFLVSQIMKRIRRSLMYV